MEQQQYGAQEKVWLVKSSGKVLGPYSIEEISFLLERRKISIIDELRSPKKRWIFIREDKTLSKVVESLRDEDARLLDNTTEIDSKTRTVITTTFNDEDTASQVREDSIIITPGNIPPPTASQTTNPRQSPSSPNANRSAPTNDRLPKLETAKTEEVTKGKNRVQSIPLKVETSTNWSFIISAIVVIGVGYGLYSVIAKPSGSQKVLSDSDYITLAQASVKVGLFEKALGFYKIVESRGKLDSTSQVYTALLGMEFGGSASEARKRIESVLPNINSGETIRADAQVGIGLSYLKDGNFSRADDTFQAVIFTNENHKEARLNYGLSKILNGDYKSGLKELATYAKTGGTDGIATIGKVIATWGVSDGQQDSVKNKGIVDDLDRYITGSSEYRNEAQLLKATALQKMGDKDGSQKVIKNLLDDDPQLSQDHSHNLLVDRSIIKWERLNLYCDYLAAKWGDSAISKSLSGYCYAQRGDFNSGLSKIETARKLLPKNNMLLSLEAWMNYKQKRINEAQQLAQQSESDSVLSQRVLALSCEEIQNWDCADQKWRRILLGNGQDLGALRGMASYQLLRNHPDQSLEFIKKGRSISENYRPLIEIKDKIEGH